MRSPMMQKGWSKPMTSSFECELTTVRAMIRLLHCGSARRGLPRGRGAHDAGRHLFSFRRAGLAQGRPAVARVRYCRRAVQAALVDRERGVEGKRVTVR